jgi:hypothetical protein
MTQIKYHFWRQVIYIKVYVLETNHKVFEIVDVLSINNNNNNNNNNLQFI